MAFLAKDIILTMLPAGSHVRQVFTDSKTGLLSLKQESNTRGSRIFLECSTIDVPTSQDIAAQVRESGLGVFADAPVSGGQGGAAAGTLTFMVGSTPAVFKIIHPILCLMGNPDHIYHCGEAGAGLATKQINNYLSAVNMIGVCEGMNMGRKYGLDLPTLANVINNSTGMSRNSREQNPVKGVSATASAAKDFEGGFSTELCYGVIKMARELGKQLDARTVLGPAVEEFYGEAIEDERCKGKDYRSIYRIFTSDDAGPSKNS